jgi:hypothetical protein
VSDRSYRRACPLSPLREHLRDTFWFAPTAGLFCAVALWWAADAVDEGLIAYLQEQQEQQAYDEVSDLVAIADGAQTIVTTVSSAMMTFIGVVFSISLVAVQTAQGAPVERDGPAVDRLGDLFAELLRLRRVDQGAEVQGGQRVGRVLDGEGWPVRMERTAGR